MLTSDFVQRLTARSLHLTLLGLAAAGCFSDAGGSSASEGGTSEADASESGTSGGDVSVSATAPASSDASGATSDDLGTTGGSSSTTAAPGMCGGSCVEEAPEGWLGPVAARENDAGASSPGCQGGFPDMVWALYGELTAEGACACSCEFTSDGCGPTSVYFYEGGCGGAPVQVSVLDSDACQIWFGDSLGGWSVDAAPHLGSCAPEITPALEDAAFATRWSACGGGVFTDECDEGVCAPAPPDGYDKLCVYREGEHACPPGAYSSQETRYSSIDDTRSCDGADCACGPVEGDCDTALKLSSEGCEIPKATVFQDCSVGSQIGSYHLEAQPNPGTSCPPVADEVPPSGGAQGLGAVTFCCM